MEIVPLAPGVASVSTLFETRLAMLMSVPKVSPTSPTGGGFGFGGAITMTLVHEAGGWRFLGGHTSTPKPRGP